MKFEKAMHDACRELGFDGHIKEIRFKKDAFTYAERIVLQFKKPPLAVKNSYLYLDGVDFCFFENKGECDFAISGYIHGNDKLDIKSAIEKALKLCELTTLKMTKSEVSDADKKCTYKETGCGSCKRQLDCPIEADMAESEDKE